jgi:hypothetical protein
MVDDEDLAEMREELEGEDSGDRADKAASQQDRQDLVESIGDELDAIDAGDRQKSVSVWDQNLAALINALDDHDDERKQIVDDLAAELGRDPPADPTRSDVVKLAVRVGLSKTDSDVVEATTDAVRKRQEPRL